MDSLEKENNQQVYDDWDIYAKEFFNTNVDEYAQELSKCF
jgi:hypothetical protein